MMEIPIYLSFILLIPSIFAFQNQYKVVIRNITIGYVNEHYILASASTSEINNTTAVNFNFTMKFDVPANLKIIVKAFIWHNDDFQLPLVQFQKNVKDTLEMEAFDLQTVLLHKCRPPVVWPLKKNVPYRVRGWIPDSAHYPPNLPQGNWKVQVIEMFPNKTKILEFNGFVSTVYH